MSSKNFKIKEGLTLQGAGITGMDTNITADNNGGILVNGAPLSPSLTELNDVTLNNPTISVDSTVFTTTGSMFMFFTDVTGMYMGPTAIPNANSITTMVISNDLQNNGSYPVSAQETGTIMLSSPLPAYTSLSMDAVVTFTGGSLGTAGQFLKSTGTGVEWAGISTLSDVTLANPSLAYTTNYLTTSPAPYYSDGHLFTEGSDSLIAGLVITPPVTNGTVLVGYRGSQLGLDYSTDNGTTWSDCTIYNGESWVPLNPNVQTSLGLVYGNGIFVLAVREGNMQEQNVLTIYTSTDGIQFTQRMNELQSSFYNSADISFENGYFFLSNSWYDAKTYDEVVYMSYSTDAINWTAFPWTAARTQLEAQGLIAPQSADHRKEVYYINGQYIWLPGGYKIYYFDTPSTSSANNYIEIQSYQAMGQGGQGTGAIAYDQGSNKFLVTTGSPSYSSNGFYVIDAEFGTGKLSITSSSVGVANYVVPDQGYYYGSAIVNYLDTIYLFTNGGYRTLTSITSGEQGTFNFSWSTSTAFSGNASNILIFNTSSNKNLTNSLKALPTTVGASGTSMISNGTSAAWSYPKYDVVSLNAYDYYVTAADVNKIFFCTIGTIFYFNDSEMPDGSTVTVIAVGSAMPSFRPNGSASINSTKTTTYATLRTQFSAATIIKYSDVDYFVAGDLA